MRSGGSPAAHGDLELGSLCLVERYEPFDHCRIFGWSLEDFDRRAEKPELVSETQKRYDRIARTDIMNGDVCQRFDDALNEGPVVDSIDDGRNIEGAGSRKGFADLFGAHQSGLRHPQNG